MKFPLATIAFIGMLLSTTGAFAGEQTVKLEVDGMFCIACSYFVKETLEEVDGVKQVEMVMTTAIVVFDDEITSVEELTAATDYMGYPSFLIEAGS